jgi:hypothetical protein
VTTTGAVNVLAYHFADKSVLEGDTRDALGRKVPADLAPVHRSVTNSLCLISRETFFATKDTFAHRIGAVIDPATTRTSEGSKPARMGLRIVGPEGAQVYVKVVALDPLSASKLLDGVRECDEHCAAAIEGQIELAEAKYPAGGWVFVVNYIGQTVDFHKRVHVYKHAAHSSKCDILNNVVAARLAVCGFADCYFATLALAPTVLPLTKQPVPPITTMGMLCVMEADLQRTLTRSPATSLGMHGKQATINSRGIMFAMLCVVHDVLTSVGLEKMNNVPSIINDLCTKDPTAAPLLVSNRPMFVEAIQYTADKLGMPVAEHSVLDLFVKASTARLVKSDGLRGFMHGNTLSIQLPTALSLCLWLGVLPYQSRVPRWRAAHRHEQPRSHALVGALHPFARVFALQSPSRVCVPCSAPFICRRAHVASPSSVLPRARRAPRACTVWYRRGYFWIPIGRPAARACLTASERKSPPASPRPPRSGLPRRPSGCGLRRRICPWIPKNCRLTSFLIRR